METTTEVRVEGRTAEEWEQAARESEQRAAESFERCDTDGFLSQWASGITAREYRAKADLARSGGKVTTSALFTMTGELVPAKMYETRYGWAWRTVEGRWINESKAQAAEKRRAYLESKYEVRVGAVEVPGRVVVRGTSKVSVGVSIIPAEDRWWTGEYEVVSTDEIGRY